MELTNIAIDIEKETEGVWHDLGDGARVKLARYNCPEFEKYIRMHTQARVVEYREKKANNELTEEYKEEYEDALSSIVTDAIATILVKDWEGFTANGEDVPFSTETALQLMRDTRLRALRDTFVSLASRQDSYRAQYIFDSVGNSQTS